MPMKKLLYFMIILTLSIFCVCVASAAEPVVFVSDAVDNGKYVVKAPQWGINLGGSSLEQKLILF